MTAIGGAGPTFDLLDHVHSGSHPSKDGVLRVGVGRVEPAPREVVIQRCAYAVTSKDCSKSTTMLNRPPKPTKNKGLVGSSPVQEAVVDLSISVISVCFLSSI